MAYIGRQPKVGNFQICDAISVVNGQAAYTMQVASVNVIPETAQNLIVSLNGVIQKPGSSYTVSSSTITFSQNLVTGDVIDFIQILGSVLDIGTPSDGTVTSAKLASQDITFSEDIILGDSKNAIFGAGSDLKIFHNGSNSFVKDVGSGALILDSNGTDVRITKSDAEFMAKFVTDGAVELYYDNSKKIETTSTGIAVAGHITAPNLNTTGSTSNRYPLYWVHSGTTGSIEPYTGSIRAMKTDINDMGSVDWIHSLTPRSFKFRDYETDEDGSKVYLETTNDLPNTEYGLIAEEVNEVSGSDYILDKQIDEDGNENLKGVLYHNLVPVLLKAVQEQKTKIQELEARITTLENK